MQAIIEKVESVLVLHQLMSPKPHSASLVFNIVLLRMYWTNTALDASIDSQMLSELYDLCMRAQDKLARTA